MEKKVIKKKSIVTLKEKELVKIVGGKAKKRQVYTNLYKISWKNIFKLFR